jgi:hypothetical protein
MEDLLAGLLVLMAALWLWRRIPRAQSSPADRPDCGSSCAGCAFARHTVAGAASQHKTQLRKP